MNYSPQAEGLLIQWSCMSLNMRSVILRSRFLQRQAQEIGREEALEAQLREKRVNALYRQIGREMRIVSNSEGVEKQFPEDIELGSMGVGRFVDFRISEEAIPELSRKLEKIDEMVLRLLLTLCTVRL